MQAVFDLFKVLLKVLLPAIIPFVVFTVIEYRREDISMSLWSGFLNSISSMSSSAGMSPLSPFTAQEYFPRNLQEIYHVAFLLRQKLPPELVPSIIDFAQYWLRSEKSLRRHESIAQRHLGRDDRGERGFMYLLSEPIAGDYMHQCSLHPVRKIIFTLSSRDQGWSSFAQDHGTRNNSWTWFDAVVQDNTPDYATAPSSRRITTNIHAGQDWERQVITWSADSENDERDWLMSLRRGQRVGIEVWARYPGWTNRVRSAKIEIFTAAVR